MKPFGHSVCHPLDELRFVLRGKMHEVRLVGIHSIGHNPVVRPHQSEIKPLKGDFQLTIQKKETEVSPRLTNFVLQLCIIN